MNDDLQPEETPVDPTEAVGIPSPLLADLPESAEEALPVLIELVAEARLALDARTEDLQRVAAEFDNFRKRAARDRDELMLRSTQRLIEDLLPVLDSFENALAHETETPAEQALMDGMESTHQQLIDVLTREGLEAIPGVGEPFDPNVHEAVMGGGEGDLSVTNEMRRGYTLGGRVIRPAMVQVGDATPRED